MSRWLRRMWSGREAKAPGGQEGATEKRRWSFWRPRECLPSAAARLNPAPACWAKFSSDEDEDEQSQRAAAGLLIADGHGTQRAAAVVIQTAFRGFLARKALKALKALIKLQALARGHLIRKQAVTTLRRMEALARAQATTIRARRSLERLSSSFDSSTKIVEIDLNAYHATRRSPALGIMDDSQLLAFHSPVPRRIAIPNRKNYHQENDCECWYAENTKGRLPATAHNTPKYMNVYGNGGGFVRVKSVASSPKFMASTQSSMAKRWSCQGRIEEPRRRQPLSEVNSCCHVEEEGFSFKSVVVGRLERPSLEHLVRKN